MQIRIVAVDKIREPYVAAACADFSKRLAPYFPVEVIEVRPSSASTPEGAMREEGARIAKLVAPEDTFWLLDREGEQLSSEALAQRVTALTHSGTRRLTLGIGGAFGTAPELRSRAQLRWSLSSLTFLHEWARMIVLEQLYRASKIMRGEPYHL